MSSRVQWSPGWVCSGQGESYGIESCSNLLFPRIKVPLRRVLYSGRGAGAGGQAETPLHRGEPSCICGISTGMCVNVETAGIAHARVHMPSTNAEPLLSGGTATAGRAGGCPGLPTHRPGLAAGPLAGSARSAQAESPWPTAAGVQLSPILSLEITNPRCGLGK